MSGGYSQHNASWSPVLRSCLQGTTLAGGYVRWNAMVESSEQELMLMATLERGVENAIGIFSRFLKLDVVADDAVTGSRLSPTVYKPERNGYLLQTPVIGDLRGNGYLLFGRKEWSYLLGHIGKHHRVPTDEMKHDCLVEIANMTSSSVVKELANALNVTVFADVPQLQLLEGSLWSHAADSSDASGVYYHCTLRSTCDEAFAATLLWHISLLN